jgi:hypothetical protein
VGERCHATRKLKTPPASEDTDGVFHAFTSFKVAALEVTISRRRFRSGFVRNFLERSGLGSASPVGSGDRGKYGSAATIEKSPRYLAG